MEAVAESIPAVVMANDAPLTISAVWERRDQATTETLEELVKCEPKEAEDNVVRLRLMLHLATSWTDHDQLRALAASMSNVCVEEKEASRLLFAQCCSALVKHAGVRGLLDALFRPDAARSQLLKCLEDGVARLEASTCLAKLGYAAVEDVKLDVLMSTFVRLLVIPLHRALDDCASQDPIPFQTAVNCSMIVAARCGSQSRDGQKKRQPDEIALFVLGGVFDALAPFIANSITFTPCMNAIQGLMVSPDAVSMVDDKGPLIQVLRMKMDTSKLAANLVNAVELLAFKRVVQKSAKEANDSGKAMGEQLLGVVGAGAGPSGLGFSFTDKEIEKDFKNHAFKEGVVKPMADKMAAEGESLNIETLAQSVLMEHSRPQALRSCGWPECTADEKDVTKRCSRCRKVFYCSSVHQNAHWAQHKKECK